MADIYTALSTRFRPQFIHKSHISGQFAALIYIMFGLIWAVSLAYPANFGSVTFARVCFLGGCEDYRHQKAGFLLLHEELEPRGKDTGADPPPSHRQDVRDPQGRYW